MRKFELGNQIRSHLGSRLVLNAYIIMAMRLFASASGFIFWATAARLLSARDVGLASGVIAASTLLAGLAQLGLGYGLVRHLPDSQTPVRLVNAVLAVVSADGLAAAVIFLVGLRFWSPALLPLLASTEAIVSFVLLVVATGLTQVLNWHFLARRSPVFSLIKNTVQSGLAVVILLVIGLHDGDYLAAVHAYTIATAASLFNNDHLVLAAHGAWVCAQGGVAPHASHLVRKLLFDELCGGSVQPAGEHPRAIAGRKHAGAGHSRLFLHRVVAGRRSG